VPGGVSLMVFGLVHHAVDLVKPSRIASVEFVNTL
jgi:hypothetical protein